MAGKYFITGAAACGKSVWAISYFDNCDEVAYIYTGDKIKDNVTACLEYREANDDISWLMHRTRRNLANVVSNDCKRYIFDSMAEYVQNLILTMCHDPDHISDEQIGEIRTVAIAEMEELLAAVDKVDGEIVVVSIETGFSLRSHLRAERVFCDILSALNQKVAAVSDEVYLAISGVQMRMK